MNKNDYIDELMPLHDEINEISFNNQATLSALQQKFPNDASVNIFKLTGTEEYEASRHQLKQLHIDIIIEMYQSAVRILDIVMSEQRQLDQLALKLNKEPISPKYEEQQSWTVLLDWGLHSDMDGLIQDLSIVNNHVQQEVSQSRSYQQKLNSQNQESDSYKNKYIAALRHISILEEQINNSMLESSKPKSTKSQSNRRKQIDNIENQIDNLSQKLESNMMNKQS